MMENFEDLKKLNFFSQMEDETIRRIGHNIKKHTFKKDAIIFKENDEPNSMYLILEGIVEIYKSNIPLAIIDKGDYFGEMSIFKNETKRSASAKAITAVIAYSLPVEIIKNESQHGNIGLLQELVNTYYNRLIKHNNTVVKQVIELKTNYQELENTHEKILQSDKLASIGLLTSSIAHEINNPLTIINGYLDMFYSEDFNFQAGMQPMAIKALGNIKTASESIRKILNHLRTYIRTNNNKLIQVNIHELIHNSIDLVSSLYKKDNIELCCDFLHNEMPIILANPGNIQQIIMNILSNAQFAVKDKNNKKILIKSKIENNHVFISVIDNGCGIPNENLNKIFDSFFTTKDAYNGTGLGLGIIKKMLAEMNGSIFVKSTVDKGSEFTFNIPLTST